MFLIYIRIYIRGAGGVAQARDKNIFSRCDRDPKLKDYDTIKVELNFLYWNSDWLSNWMYRYHSIYLTIVFRARIEQVIFHRFWLWKNQLQS